MSAIFKPGELTTSDAAAIVLDDTSIFNLPVVSALIGFTNTDATKRWCKEMDIDHEGGRVWVFSGKVFRKQLEVSMERKRAAREKGEVA